jgi:hypothetical protein
MRIPNTYVPLAVVALLVSAVGCGEGDLDGEEGGTDADGGAAADGFFMPADAGPSPAMGGPRFDLGPGGLPPRDAAVPDVDAVLATRDAEVPDEPDDPDNPPAQCPEGSRCGPIRVDTFPFVDRRDTRDAPESAFDRYGCAPDTDESGPEFHYEVVVAEAGTLTARVDDVPDDDVDIDIHLLGADDPSECIVRDNRSFRVEVVPGVYRLVADTWVGSRGAYPGPYVLEIEWAPLVVVEPGACDMVPTDVRMFWRDCDPDLDCYEAGGEVYLRTPSLGPVVKEAHLVTVEEPFRNDWPTSFTNEIERHYALSEAATGYVMDRREPWAPAGEGGSRFGQGSTGRPIPVVDEAWYVNMYWRDRPAGGTRMIIRNPENGRAVVASAGWETGPGSNAMIGGAVEEIHHALGSNHRSVLEFGFAADPDLPLGPIDCR